MTDKTELEVTQKPCAILRIHPNNQELLRITSSGEVIAPTLESASEAGRYFVESMRGHLDMMREAIRAELSQAATSAARTTDPTPVAWSDEESFKHLRLLYNYTDNDSHQFTRWQMVVAMSHGMRLARQPAVPADGLVEALAKGGFMMTETHNVGEHCGRKLVIGFQNPDEADDAMQAIAVAVKTFRSAA